MYIDSICSIGPVGTFSGTTRLSGRPVAADGRLLCSEPDYKDLIPPMQLRRMSKPVRTGVAAAKICLDGFNDLAAINIGTAYGMLQDSETFLDKMIIQEEQLLNPTAFIQSTHNTVGGQIALSLQCNAHNMTYVHKGHSFESALLDTELLLARDDQQQKVLVGAVDECTDTSFSILAGFGIYNEIVTAGEGAHFYLLSGRQSAASRAKIEAFDMFVAQDIVAVADNIGAFIRQQAMQPAVGDIFISGTNGSDLSTEYYHYLVNHFFRDIEVIPFKEFSGEYPTASGFAPALAVSLLDAFNAAWIVNNYGPYWSIYHIRKTA